MLSTTTLTKDNFEDVIRTNALVIVDFWAPWCGPCRAFAPTFEKSSEKHADVVHAKVNTDEEQELAGSFGIRSIPTLMIFREQVILYSEPGALPPQALENLIVQVKAVDMAAVHKQLAEQESGAEGGG
jgi:thioredoxin 1